MSEEYRNLVSCYSEHVHENMEAILNIKRSIEALPSKTDEDYFCALPSTAKKYIENTVSNLDVPENSKAKCIGKNKHISRMQKYEKDYTCKFDDTTLKMPKMRKRKGKLRSFTSKSTVITKVTNFATGKEAKKRKCRGRKSNLSLNIDRLFETLIKFCNAGHDINCQQSILPKHPEMSNDVVEIFHNTTLKNSCSGVPNKYSKLDRKAKYLKKYCIETANPKIQEKSCSENVNHDEFQSNNKKNKQNLQTLDCQKTSEVTSKNIQEQKSGKVPIDLPIQLKTYQHNHIIFNKYNDPMLTPNYEMPTLASKLKRSNRTYFNKFNFQNIPFVVGTSVTPSHNLGLNIQQVLNIMKTKQPIADITPLLIHNVSRGTKPMSILLQQINRQCQKSVLNVNSEMIEIFNSKNILNNNQDKKLSTLDLQQKEKTQSIHILNSDNTKMVLEKNNDISIQFYKEKSNFYKNEKIKQQSHFVSSKSNGLASARLEQEISRISLNKEDTIGDREIYTPSSHNSKEIRLVLINLHDQFEEMNRKYEKLQSEVEKSNNKTLAKELSILEKDLNIKEKEINIVIGLYKEVMTLKQQMKMLHDKNNLICMATESFAKTHKNPFSISIIPEKSHLIKMTQINGKKGSIYKAIREPPISMQLTTLLHQIQTFHKQLQLTS